MRKLPIAHYQTDGSSFFVNGGKLIVTDSEYILKNFIKTIARFPIKQTSVHKAPDIQLYEGITLTYRDQCVHVYVFPRTARDLYSCLSFSTDT